MIFIGQNNFCFLNLILTVEPLYYWSNWIKIQTLKNLWTARTWLADISVKICGHLYQNSNKSEIKHIYVEKRHYLSVDILNLQNLDSRHFYTFFMFWIIIQSDKRQIANDVLVIPPATHWQLWQMMFYSDITNKTSLSLPGQDILHTIQ